MWSPNQIQQILAATGQIQNDESVTGFGIDSRTIKSGEAFIAIKGDRFDGHDFIEQVIEKGVRTIISQKEINFDGVTCLQVPDTLIALQSLAENHRQQFKGKVIGITGSTGKTTTKEWLYTILSSEKKVFVTKGNENNHIGVPLNLLKLTSEYDVAVIEMGTNQPGDIETSGRFVNPDEVILLNIGPSHLEKLKSLEGVYQEKKQIVDTMKDWGKVFYSVDDPFLQRLETEYATHPLIAVGENENADYKLRYEYGNQKEQIFSINGHMFHVYFHQESLIPNVAMGISVALEMGIDLNSIHAALKNLSFMPGRQEVYLINNIEFIHDCYNANPVSVKAAFKALEKKDVEGKKIVICGDMKELGEESRNYHQILGDELADFFFDTIIFFGSEIKYAAERIPTQSNFFTENEYPDMIEFLKRILEPNDVVLIKGSRGMRMERILKEFKHVDFIS